MFFWGRVVSSKFGSSGLRKSKGWPSKFSHLKNELPKTWPKTETKNPRMADFKNKKVDATFLIPVCLRFWDRESTRLVQARALGTTRALIEHFIGPKNFAPRREPLPAPSGGAGSRAHARCPTCSRLLKKYYPILRERNTHNMCNTCIPSRAFVISGWHSNWFLVLFFLMHAVSCPALKLYQYIVHLH